MRTCLWTITLATLLGFNAAGCKDEPDEVDTEESVGEEVEEAAEDTGEAVEEAADDAEDAVDEAAE